MADSIYINLHDLERGSVASHDIIGSNYQVHFLREALSWTVSFNGSYGVHDNEFRLKYQINVNEGFCQMGMQKHAIPLRVAAELVFQSSSIESQLMSFHDRHRYENITIAKCFWHSVLFHVESFSGFYV